MRARQIQTNETSTLMRHYVFTKYKSTVMYVYIVTIISSLEFVIVA
jgi:hypothetical protein